MSNIEKSTPPIKVIYMVYVTDFQHSYASRDLIGVGLSREHAMNIIAMKAEKDGDPLSEDDMYNLKHINQTQGYDGCHEFVIDEVEPNILL